MYRGIKTDTKILIYGYHIRDDKRDFIYKNDSPGLYSILPTSLQRGTTMKDVNNKEIYAGDIVHLMSEEGYEDRTDYVVIDLGPHFELHAKNQMTGRMILGSMESNFFKYKIVDTIYLGSITDERNNTVLEVQMSKE